MAFVRTGFPQGLENRENREKNNGQGKVREKSGNFILGQKSGKSQGICLFWAKSQGISFQNGSMPRFLSNINMYIYSMKQLTCMT